MVPVRIQSPIRIPTTMMIMHEGMADIMLSSAAFMTSSYFIFSQKQSTAAITTASMAIGTWTSTPYFSVATDTTRVISAIRNSATPSVALRTCFFSSVFPSSIFFSSSADQVQVLKPQGNFRGVSANSAAAGTLIFKAAGLELQADSAARPFIQSPDRTPQPDAF